MPIPASTPTNDATTNGGDLPPSSISVTACWCAAPQRALAFGRCLFACALVLGCSDKDAPGAASEPDAAVWACQLDVQDDAPDYLDQLGCEGDFEALASEPLDASIPGARSTKVVLDLCADAVCSSTRLYFQNSEKYAIHWEFASAYLDDPMSPIRHVGSLADFNSEYTAPLAERRFLLGAVTYYEDPDVWALEIAPYDTSTPEMIEQLYDAVRATTYFGSDLQFHPTSEAIELRSADLSTNAQVTTTDELYADIEYQPLNLGETVGPLRFVSAVELDEVYVTTRDIVVLDAVPNDVAPVSGLITEEFQTPLSHINVLARNRGTPNMGLRDARAKLEEMGFADGDHVRLIVGAFDYEIAPATVEESDAWWTDHLPPPVSIPEPDLSVTDLRDIQDVTEHTDEPPYVEVEAIRTAARAFGAKSAQYSVFSTDPRVPSKPGFGIPVYYYEKFMREGEFFDRIEALREDSDFTSDTATRDAALDELRDDIKAAPMDDELASVLSKKLEADFPNRSIRFRSSTNAEDLDGFPCAGCYDSHTGDPAEFGGDQLAAAFDAIKKTWATVWSLRTYDERELHGIDHMKVAMGLLVHTNFPEEEANGVAITGNPFDATGNAPGFYVNVQEGGEFEVVHPPAGITSDSFLYQYSFPNQPIIYYTHSNVTMPAGTDVLTVQEIHSLGAALEAINDRFRHAFGTTDGGFWAMDCEFKFDDEADPGNAPSLYVKQARPYPRGEER